MKSPYILPVFTAIAGFAVAWVAKPAPAPSSVVGKTEESGSGKAPVRSGPAARLSPEDGRKPKEVNAGDFPLADKADQGPKTRDEARMLRLTEALGLSIDQQGSIISLIEDVQSKADPDEVYVIRDLSKRGKMIEEELAKILSPEQLAKFEELRVRERENRAEDRAQRMLIAAVDVDMSPEQRQQILERLRQKAKADMQTIPASATLLLDKSMLPTNNKELSVDGVLLLAQMGEEVASMDAGEAHQQILTRQRQELEDTLECYDGILTAGQMGQFQAAILEQRQILNRLPTNPVEANPQQSQSQSPSLAQSQAQPEAQIPEQPQGAGSLRSQHMPPEEGAEVELPPIIQREPYNEVEDEDEEDEASGE